MRATAKESTTLLLDIVNTRPSHFRKRFLFIVVIVAGLGAGGFFLASGGDASAPLYRTEAVVRDSLVVTVSATGNLQPTNQVDVGSELSGTVVTVSVDDNDRVKKGQVLARLDASRLEDQVARSQAALAAAQAQVAQMRATVTESQANLARLRQMAELSGGELPSKAELLTAEANQDRAKANEAAARASVAQAEAVLKSDQTNLAKAAILSPIEGVVLLRQVEPGQTVAASLQAPVLFTLAENLAQMRLQVDVDEADVGQVRSGQKATFTVDAWPGRRYPALVTRVSYGSQVKEGVVSYKTLLDVDNDDLSLRPGMTATATIVTARREDALLVPNAALRFSPQANTTRASSGSLISRLMPTPPAQPKQSSGKTAAQQVWVLQGGEPVAVAVTTGASDGRMTEILSGDLQTGAAVITESVVRAR